MEKLDKLLLIQEVWYADRKIIDRDNDDLTKLIQLLMTEVLELQEEAGNGADPEKMKRESADIGWFLFAIFRHLEGDIFEEMREKAALNVLRYDWKEFQDGDYNEARKRIKENENEIIEEFYGEE